MYRRLTLRFHYFISLKSFAAVLGGESVFVVWLIEHLIAGVGVVTRDSTRMVLKSQPCREPELMTRSSSL